jgi:BolA protein
LTEPKTQLSRASRIENLVRERFAPQAFELIDDSAKHAGHAGARPGGQTHYRLRMVSSAFAGLNRVARQRLILDALREEFDTGLHALSLELKAPEEIA